MRLCACQVDIKANLLDVNAKITAACAKFGKTAVRASSHLFLSCTSVHQNNHCP